MITNYGRDSNGNLVKKGDNTSDDVLWCDVLNPSRDERLKLETENAIRLPQHNETLRIEYSNRFYEQNGALYMSVQSLVKAAPYPETHNVTFILTSNKLITLRFTYANPINEFVKKFQNHQYRVNDQFDVLVLILQQMVGTIANIFELIGTSTDLLAMSLMQTIEGSKRRDHSVLLNKALREISKFENVISKGFQSLSSFMLVINFFESTNQAKGNDVFKRFQSTLHDISGLSKHADYLTQKLEFQLESTLGLLNIEQTYIIKMFTVLAMVFMPPTLIASIYGMNFQFIPELHTKFGYPFALVLMLLSSFLPYRFFKKRGWI